MTQRTSSLTITSWQYEKQQIGIGDFLADWAHNKRKIDEKKKQPIIHLVSANCVEKKIQKKKEKT